VWKCVKVSRSDVFAFTISQLSHTTHTRKWKVSSYRRSCVHISTFLFYTFVEFSFKLIQFRHFTETTLNNIFYLEISCFYSLCQGEWVLWQGRWRKETFNWLLLKGFLLLVMVPALHAQVYRAVFCLEEKWLQYRVISAKQNDNPRFQYLSYSNKRDNCDLMAHACFSCNSWCLWSRDSAVGIAIGYGPDGRVVGVRVPEGARFFSMSSKPILGAT
jgi:hypothetical protein